MSCTSLHLSECMQWSSILSGIKNYPPHFLKSNFEMLAKLWVLCLRILLSMWTTKHQLMQVANMCKECYLSTDNNILDLS
uniref:Uncharacterized protein n=1 Tax=Arundo donax TaxID=35708 RepID=A0A0A9DS73_ARUDO